MYLSNEGEPSSDGGGSPSYFVSKRKLMINHVNTEVLELSIKLGYNNYYLKVQVIIIE